MAATRTQRLPARPLLLFSRYAHPAVKQRGLLTNSYAEGPVDPPLLETTIPEHLASVVSQHGDRQAVISRHQNRILTFEQLDSACNRLAHGLAKRGVSRGDRCAVMLGNSIEHATITHALFKLGAILVPLNPGFSSSQVISSLNHLTAQHLIISTETCLPRRSPRSNVPLLESIVSDLHSTKLESQRVKSMVNLILVDNSNGRFDEHGKGDLKAAARYDDVLEDGSATHAFQHQELCPDDVVNIQFTSGTTSQPKAAMLTHRNILNNGYFIGSRLGLTPDDVVCCPPPLFHCFGCILGLMATITHGSSIVFPSEAFDAEASLRAVQEYHCTALYGVPTMYLAELELLADGTVPRHGLGKLRTGIAAGSSIPAELMRKLHRELNLTELSIVYGMTETSPVSLMTVADDPMEQRINSVGRLLPHVKAKIVDAQDWSKILPIGQRGELVVSGYLTMKGYWGDPKRTAEVLVSDEEGRKWMHTGDEAIMDAQGYVSITGRIKDLIIRGGENIHPLEIENCLLAHPGISEVSVVGIPDLKYGEVVAAYIIKSGRGDGAAAFTREEVRDWVRMRLSHHLVPKFVFWVNEEGYPKTSSGKIQKFKLREMGLKMVEAGEGL